MFSNKMNILQYWVTEFFDFESVSWHMSIIISIISIHPFLLSYQNSNGFFIGWWIFWEFEADEKDSCRIDELITL